MNQLHRIILSKTYRRRLVFKKVIPVYRVTGVVEGRVSSAFLNITSIEEKISKVSNFLESQGYVKGIILVYENSLHFLFGQCRLLKEAKLLEYGVKKSISEHVNWPILINLFDPDGDIPLKKYSSEKYKVIRARKPLGVDAYLHEIVAELFYHPEIPANITVERLKEDMGSGRFQAAMAALRRATRKLEEGGWLITVSKRNNLPGIILTPEGFTIAQEFAKKQANSFGKTPEIL